MEVKNCNRRKWNLVFRQLNWTFCRFWLWLVGECFQLEENLILREFYWIVFVFSRWLLDKKVKHLWKTNKNRSPVGFRWTKIAKSWHDPGKAHENLREKWEPDFPHVLNLIIGPKKQFSVHVTVPVGLCNTFARRLIWPQIDTHRIFTCQIITFYTIMKNPIRCHH